MEVIHAFIDPILEDALAKKATGENKFPIHEDDTRSETLLDHLAKQVTGEYPKPILKGLTRRSTSTIIRPCDSKG